MRFGILETLGLAASLVFALPVGGLGVTLLLDGQYPLGGGLLVVAVLMVVLPRRLTTPGDLPAAVVERAVGAAVEVPEEDE
jgi:hypothetical protein